MQRVVLGDNLRASRLGVGALHFGILLDPDASTVLLRRAEDLGVTFIDTAPMYGAGRSQEIIGHALRGRRGRFVIATKVGLVPRPRPDGSFGAGTVTLTGANIRRSVEQSLRALGTDWIDLLQLHYFDGETPLEETFAVIDALVAEGKVRAVGGSNYNEAELKTVMAFCSGRSARGLVSVQAHLNLIERRAEELLPSLRRWGIGMIVNRALARGILSGQYRSGEPLPPGSRAASSERVRRWLDPATVNLVQELAALAQASGRSLSQLALGWLWARPEVGVVLMGARNTAQLEEGVASLDGDMGDLLGQAEQLVDRHGLRDQVNRLPPELFER